MIMIINNNNDDDDDDDNDNNINLFNKGKPVIKCCYQRVPWETKNRNEVTIKILKRIQHM